MNKKIIFSHIPKTAGTSFRNGLKESIGEDKLLYDYGYNSPDTSKCIFDCYNKNNFSDLPNVFQENNKEIIFSHFQDTKIKLSGYFNLFPEAKLCAIFRDPLSRALSEYIHFRDRLSYPKSFNEFISNVEFVNRQSASVDFFSINSFDFIGITEQYDESLYIFEKKFGIHVENIFSNSRNGNEKYSDIILECDLIDFCNKNIDDITLYNKAVISFHRLAGKKPNFFIGKSRFVGSMSISGDGTLIGWGYDSLSDKPIEVTFESIKGAVGMIACLYRLDLVQEGIHCSGYCGFKMDINNIRKLIGSGKIYVRFPDGSLIGSFDD